MISRENIEKRVKRTIRELRANTPGKRACDLGVNLDEASRDPTEDTIRPSDSSLRENERRFSESNGRKKERAKRW